MQTNQELIRPMGEFEVTQRTKDAMFNATALLKQWNDHSGQQKQMIHFFDNETTQEFIQAIAEDALQGTGERERKSVFVDKQALKQIYIKSRGGIGGGGSTWMHPLLFIDFAMWLNPKFKLVVLKFVYDQLIEFRIEAGNTYKDMCTQIASISKKSDVQKNIAHVARLSIISCTANMSAKCATSKPKRRR